jgi:CheY-like chemotaxis protein
MSLVLVVDDELAIRDLLAFVLREEGHQVRTASDGQDALAQLAMNKPDLVLLDVMMPVLDGREVLKHIRADATLRRVPILVMSAAADLSVLDGGFDGYLAKPFDLHRLITLVNDLLRQEN